VRLKKKIKFRKKEKSESMIGGVHTNGVMLLSIPDFQFLHPNKSWKELIPNPKHEPNLGGLGVVPKMRVDSAPLPSLSNQTHG
jgi:hypothetical protein